MTLDLRVTIWFPPDAQAVETGGCSSILRLAVFFGMRHINILFWSTGQNNTDERAENPHKHPIR